MDNPIQCKHCTRTFKSPMALGGHMRVHKSKAKPSLIEPNIPDLPNKKHRYMGSTSSSSNYSSGGMVSSAIENTNDAAKVLMMMMVQVEQYYEPLQVIFPVHADAPAEPEPEPVRQYVCRDCNKSFKSHYALGGHRSKHNPRRLLALPPPNQGLRRSLRLFGVDLKPYEPQE